MSDVMQLILEWTPPFRLEGPDSCWDAGGLLLALALAVRCCVAMAARTKQRSVSCSGAVMSAVLLLVLDSWPGDWDCAPVG